MNIQNLKPFTATQSHEEAVKNGKKGGIASGQARREKRTLHKLLNEFLDMDISQYEALAETAKQYGVADDKSIKELFTVVCAVNSLKNGDLSELETLVKLLGEVPEVEDVTADRQAEFLEAIKNAVTEKGA